jgi:hypothetical protein
MLLLLNKQMQKVFWTPGTSFPALLGKLPPNDFLHDFIGATINPVNARVRP